MRIRHLILATAVVFAAIFTLSGVFAPREAAAAEQPVSIYFFWGDGCPHCAKAEPFLAGLDQASDAVKLYKYEVYYDAANQRLLQQVAAKLGISASGVPVIIVGDVAHIGYSDTIAADVRSRVDRCTANGCPDSVAALTGALAAAVPETAVPENSEPKKDSGTDGRDKTVTLPLFGEVNLKDFSLPVLTVIIGALDGFNPCAMWTLLFLISLLLGMENRRRMWALGGAFIASSAFVYFLFMTAWLNIFLFIGFVTWVKVLIGVVALGAGGYYLYDFFRNHNGTCKVTGSEKRQATFERLKRITQHQSFWLALGGIVLLAFAVNLVELVCSAGLPAVYTGVLSGAGLPAWQYYAYLGLYIFVFMFDDMFVFMGAMLTLKMVGMHAGYARYSRIIGGVVMLMLGILLIFAPQVLMFG